MSTRRPLSAGPVAPYNPAPAPAPVPAPEPGARLLPAERALLKDQRDAGPRAPVTGRPGTRRRVLGDRGR
ncbi:hypothetical protein ACH4L5_36790 [Streptomyces sp. NPDC017405]|uniref:hypothetical protein n=1 Tax=unclassified Streptomyces TaxID=2593676 RepID=UPI0037AFEAF7